MVVIGAFGEIISKKLVNGNIVDVVAGTASLSANLRLQIGKPYVMFPNNPKVLIATGKWENHLMVVNGDKVTTTVGLWCHKKPISVSTPSSPASLLMFPLRSCFFFFFDWI